MIPLTDLRIGNIVIVPLGACMNTNRIVKVTSIGEQAINSWRDMGASGGVRSVDIKPVILSEKTLLDNCGFSLVDGRVQLFINESFCLGMSHADPSLCILYFNGDNTGIAVRTLHELQNLYNSLSFRDMVLNIPALS